MNTELTKLVGQKVLNKETKDVSIVTDCINSNETVVIGKVNYNQKEFIKTFTILK